MRRFVPTPPRRPEGMRWLRSDGKPNISDRIYKVEGDAQIMATRPVYTTAKTSPVLEAAELIAYRWVRALPVIHPGDKTLVGIVTAMDMVNYFGGGEYYNIVQNRHKDNIFHALRLEPVESIMNPNPVTVGPEAKLPDIIEKMVVHNIGVLPVVLPDGRVYGIITEHDIVERLIEKNVGRRVEEVMSKNVVTIDKRATVKEAAETMVKFGFRRLPIVDEETGEIWGMITAKDIVRYFGRHDAFSNAPSGKMSEALSVPVTLVGTKEFYTIEPEADVGEAATKMMERKVSSLLVVKDGKLVGIITERDILFAVATAKSPTV
ncbi:CBS domain-containing protein [Pyrolobus fumarii]|nr:CBS domain-containing protein [Pyrolobus fumarii]